MKKLIIFNWKINPHNAASAIKLARLVEKSIPKKNAPEVVIAPPFTFLEDVGKVVKKAKLGAQDAFWKDVGPYTGEVSWHQEKHLKVKYVIVGHSERRKYLGETDQMINKKVLAALKAKLKVVLCVGENLSIRRRGKKAVEKFIKNQLKKDLKNIIHNSKLITHNLIVAYEPIWAIGTKHSDTPQDAYDMVQFIREILTKKHKIQNPKVIYGGSVNSKNIKNFIEYLPRRIPKGFLRGKEIDGVLVGGASLKMDEIKKIVEIRY